MEQMTTGMMDGKYTGLSVSPCKRPFLAMRRDRPHAEVKRLGGCTPTSPIIRQDVWHGKVIQAWSEQAITGWTAACVCLPPRNDRSSTCSAAPGRGRRPTQGTASLT